MTLGGTTGTNEPTWAKRGPRETEDGRIVWTRVSDTPWTWLNLLSIVAERGDPMLAEWMREVARAYLNAVIDDLKRTERGRGIYAPDCTI